MVDVCRKIEFKSILVKIKLQLWLSRVDTIIFLTSDVVQYNIIIEQVSKLTF